MKKSANIVGIDVMKRSGPYLRGPFTMSEQGLLSCCYCRCLEDYTDYISRIPEAPSPILTHPICFENIPPYQAKTVRVNTKTNVRAAQAMLRTANFANLEQFEIRLTKSLNVACVSPYLLRQPFTVKTLCFRCVPPDLNEYASESEYGVKLALQNLFVHFTHLSCLSISVCSTNTATSPNDYIAKSISTVLSSKSLRVLKLSFPSFEGLDLGSCTLDIHTIELDEIETENIPNVYNTSRLPEVDLSQMKKLVKVVVRTPRRLRLSDDNPCLRKLVLCNVRHVYGDVSNVSVLNLANVDTSMVDSLVVSAVESLQELGVYGCTPLSLRLGNASNLKSIFLQSLHLHSMDTPNESPLRILCMRSVTVVNECLAISAKQVLLRWRPSRDILSSTARSRRVCAQPCY